MVLAHQGGWDEALFVLVPLALFGLLLWRVSRRADREQLEQIDPGSSDTGTHDR
jgi:hypothetical protein